MNISEHPKQTDRTGKEDDRGKRPGSDQKGPNDVRRFIKKKANTKESYILDEEKIREEERYDGYYALATNIYDMPLKSILKIAAKPLQDRRMFPDHQDRYEWKTILSSIEETDHRSFHDLLYCLITVSLIRGQARQKRHPFHYTPDHRHIEKYECS